VCDAGASHPWERGVADPYKHAPPHLYYRAKFDHSRSNHMGIGWESQKFSGHWVPDPLRWQYGWPLTNTPLHHVLLCWNGHSGTGKGPKKFERLGLAPWDGA